MSSLGDSPLVAFGQTTKVEDAKAFYENVLGLEVVEDTPFALLMRGANALLRIQKVQTFNPQPFTVLGWEVDDIAATVSKLASRGVTFQRFDGMDQDEMGVWRSPQGSRVAWFKDPDGNLLSVSAMA